MDGLGEQGRVVTHGFGDGDAAGHGFREHGSAGVEDYTTIDYEAGNYDATGTGKGVGRPTCSEWCRGHG